MQNEKEIINAIENAGAEVAQAIENLNTGHVYGDNLIDTLGDIALSLRILSGRSTIENGKEKTK